VIRDFTLSSFRSLVESLLSRGFVFLDLESFIASDDRKKVFLRHDVDQYTGRVEKFAALEKSLGIRSTFYFRPPKTRKHRQIIAKTVQYGQDIGYHYNDLAENNGNEERAKRSFSRHLTGLRSMGEVKSVCMHGNAFSSVNNLDLWKNTGFGELGLTGDPYLVIDHNHTLYLTDTGRCWNCARFSKWDKVTSPISYHPVSVSSIISDIESDALPSSGLHLCIHPQHYHDHPLKWTAYYFSQYFKNQVKARLI